MNAAILVHRINLFFGGLIAILSVPLAAQEFTAPTPLLVDEAFRTTSILQADTETTETKWKSSLNLGATYASGNTSLRTANFGAEAIRKVGQHQTTLSAAWNYSEQKDDTTKQWDLDQRRTTGAAKHQRFFTAAERIYAFAAVDAEGNYSQNVDLRLTGTVGLGDQIIKSKKLKVSIELGAGYFTETSRTSGVPDTDFITGRAGWGIDWQMTEHLQLRNDLKFFFSLEDDREMYGEVDTKLRATFGKGMFAQAQWLVQWDNTPSPDANGIKAHSVDHLVLLAVGWTF